MPFTLEYYETASGRCPVEDFIDRIREKKPKAFIKRTLDLLARDGVDLVRPYVAHIEDDIYELRCKTHHGLYRFLFFPYEQRYILVHAILKKTQRIRRSDIRLAISRRNDFLDRHQTS